MRGREGWIVNARIVVRVDDDGGGAACAGEEVDENAFMLWAPW